jgi:hypothetical protein
MSVVASSLISGSRVTAFSTWLAVRQPRPSTGVPQGKNRPAASVWGKSMEACASGRRRHA